MKLRIFALGVICAVCLPGQRARHRFSWQNACFNNPALHYCQGRDFAIKQNKKQNPSTPAAGGGGIANTDTLPDEDVAPSVFSVSAINWRFADPAADTLAAVSFSHLAPSQFGRFVLSVIGADQGLKEADMEKIFDAFSGIDQIAFSMRGDRMLMMVTGCAAECKAPPLEAGWKAAPVGTAMIIGPAESLDEALQRISKDGPVPELARSAGTRQANGDIWIASSGAIPGVTGLQRYSVKASMRSRLTSESIFEFSQTPDGNALEALMAGPGVVSVEKNAVHVKASVEADKVQQSLPEIAGSPLGEFLAALDKSARYLPIHDAKQAKPKIAGLDPR